MLEGTRHAVLENAYSPDAKLSTAGIALAGNLKTVTL
jgi:hypothetical protein